MNVKDRLTAHNKAGQGIINMDGVSDVLEASARIRTFSPLIISKLTEYEDTGLSPNEIERLKSENAALRERLEKAVELPCIEPMTTWDWDENTGCGEAHFGKFWQVLYRDNDGEFIAYIGATKEEATAMLAELKGEK